MRALLLLPSIALALAACGVETGAPPTPEVSGSAACEGTGPSVETSQVYSALRSYCIGCHDQGPRGYFASLTAFQSLLVADARLVVPGDAGASELVKLLEGNGTGAFKQMPIGGAPYAQIARGVTMGQIRGWIDNLGAQTRSVRPDRDAPVLTRLSATQIQRALYQQLGLTHEDFFRPGTSYDVPYADRREENDYPFQGPDALPAPREREQAERFFHLGGGSVLTQVEAHKEVSASFVHALTALSQRWCRMALAKSGNTALFPPGQPGPGRDPDSVRTTIRRWSRHFHGRTMSPDEIEQVYQTVFVPLDTTSGNEPANVGLCSYFIRHPRWIFY